MIEKRGKVIKKISIVVAAYNRANSLERVLNSLSLAKYPEGKNVELIISLDKDESNNVVKLAKSFEWDHGDKLLIVHPKNLGLKKHILSCGDLVLDKKRDAIVLLEDDLFVGPNFYSYAQKAVSFFESESYVAGIALYSHRFNESGFMSFTPSITRYENYFLQVPCSWGQVWTKSQWGEFKAWYSEVDENVFDKNKLLPRDVLKWPDTSWKKYFFQYMVEKDKYFVYPYNSLSTNFADVGTHHFDERTTLQVPISFKSEFEGNLARFNDGAFVYDSHCEILPEILKKMSSKLASYDFDVDLYGSKELHHLKRPYVITSKTLSGSFEMKFSRSLKPHELNIAWDLKGEEFFLIKTSSLKSYLTSGDGVSDIHKNSYYFNIPVEYLKIDYLSEEKSDNVINKAQEVVQEFNEYQILKKSKIYKFLKWIKLI